MNRFSQQGMKSLLPVALLSALLLNSGCQTDSVRVMVSSWSADDQKLSMDVQPSLERQTYILARGSVRKNDIRDDSLDNTTFRDVVGAMVEALKINNYYLAPPDPEQIDLLIVVHYGATMVFRDEILIPSGYVDPDTGIEEEIWIEQVSDQSIRENIAILGAHKLTELPSFTTEYRDLMNAVEEERYFFVVVAYDWQGVMKKEKIVRWVTRFSTPQRRVSFDEAMKSMTRVAADYFGFSSDASFKRTEYGPQTEVIIGEMEVLGPAEEEDGRPVNSAPESNDSSSEP